MSEVEWQHDALFLAMGARDRFDYTGLGTPFRDRLGNCYEFAARAFPPLSRVLDVEERPSPAMLVHGSWHGPGGLSRIDHAWVLLADGRVWEPITALLCNRLSFYEFTRADEHHRYRRDEALGMMTTHQHFGPWDVSGNGITSDG